ncbi:endo-1,4-beta-xylanase, partial [Xanthomonas arboricola]|uniref:endo-1,4-beta-xylanase n=1 Tax=Xanthomonas arboricola TaxID=56448 RepID=UPI0015E41E30
MRAWGVSDGMSWKNDYPVPGRTNYPLLLDRNHQPNRLLKYQPRREAQPAEFSSTCQKWRTIDH